MASRPSVTEGFSADRVTSVPWTFSRSRVFFGLKIDFAEASVVMSSLCCQISS
ncbi:hypothetical protein D3C83_316760 [compost metagenome]